VKGQLCVVFLSSYLPVELAHRHRFGVEDVGLDALVEGVVGRVLRVMEGLQRIGQDAVDGGLASAGRPDQHDTVTHQHGLVQLDHLVVEEEEEEERV